MKLPKLTFWKSVFLVVMAIGMYATYVRIVHGLGASTNLSDEFPWGIWVGFDVLCGVMLAAGGFTLMAATHIFHADRLKPIVRPTLLTAYLGYMLVTVALLYDLGRAYRIWHPLIMWNPRSVMFEVGWCVTLYSTVLSLEFAPIVLERFRAKFPGLITKVEKVLHAVSLPIVIAGVLLSTLHQSSLGTVYLIVPNKLHPLWYSPLLPAFFFISAIAVGLGMTIFESNMSAKHFKRQLELPLLVYLGRIMVVVLAAYAVLKIQDMTYRHAWQYALQWTYEARLWWLEIGMGIIVPLAMLAFKRVRENGQGLYFASLLVVIGMMTNRLNVSITGMESSAGLRYLPKWTEFGVTAMIVALGVAVFAMAVKYLPIFEEEKHHSGPSGPHSLHVRKPAMDEEAVLVHGD